MTLTPRLTVGMIYAAGSLSLVAVLCCEYSARATGTL